MRCLSPHPKYSIQVFEGNEQIVVDARGYAQTVTLAKPEIANFDNLGLLDYEIEAALENFDFSGLPEGVSPLARIGVFDTEAYCQRLPKDKRDEMVVQMNERLRELQEQNPTQFIVVDPPQAARPWPSYDDDSVEDILKFQERLRIKPESIRLYEEQNKNRREIVAAMLRLDDPEGAERIYGSEADEVDEQIEVQA